MTDAARPSPEETAGDLRAAMVERLRADGVACDERVAAALSTVPRHLFLPGVAVEEACANRAVVLKRDSAGGSMSSVSEPGIVAAMLEQLDVRPGQRVLEIGSGGYNAALLAELVGPRGRVVSVDIDPEVVERAQRGLAAAGCPAVDVLCSDGTYGAPWLGPFDRVIVTVGAWDLAPAWTAQLAPDGRLVVPLRIRGLTRSIAFEPVGGHLAGRSSLPCGFVPMQGAGAHHERRLPLAPDVQLWLDGTEPAVAAVDGVPDGLLDAPRRAAWTGVSISRRTSLADLDLWLACAVPGYGVLRLRAPGAAGLEPALRWGGSAALDGATLGYLTARPAGDAEHVELGAYGHGPAADALVGRLAGHVRDWDGARRPGPRIDAWPADTPDERLPAAAGMVTKRHVRLAVDWRPG